MEVASAPLTAGTVAAPLTLPSPDPLVSLIDFGNLHKVLAYILENLKNNGDRLSKLESKVHNLSESHNNLGDQVNSLKSLVLTMKPGGSESDLAELHEKINVVTGRVDNQTREIVGLSNLSREHGRQLEVLESSTSALQTLMPTKADAAEVALKANKSVTDRHDREIEELQAAKLEHDARLKILENGLKRLSQAVEALAQDEFKQEAIRRISDLENQLKLLTETVNHHTLQIETIDNTLPTKASQVYVDNELENLLNKLRELELSLANSMKGELKRFERDVMIYVADQITNGQANAAAAAGGANGANGGAGGGGHQHTTAAGRFHYRCLTCDQPRENVPGASTFRYGRAMGQQGNSTNANNQLPASDSRLLELQMGDQIYLHGTDGGIYRGRTDPPANLALLPAPQSSSSSQQLIATGDGSVMMTRLRQGGSPERRKATGGSNHTSALRPQSADPSRLSGHRQIDPTSGRKSSEMMSLPLHAGGLESLHSQEMKEQGYGESNTSRTLFPSPSKKQLSGGNTARAGSLSRSTSNDQLISSSRSVISPLSHRAGGSTSGMHSARPSTATARTSPPSELDPSGGRVLMGKLQSEPKISSVSKNGVEIMNEPE